MIITHIQQLRHQLPFRKELFMISLIVAMGKNNEIGLNNKMPWHLPNDLQYFKQRTTGNIVIMGRKTYESIGNPLPNRKNIVLTRQNLNLPEDVEIIHSIGDIKRIASENKGKTIFVIGGAEVYKQTMPLADQLFITQINESFEADAFFPAFNRSEWNKVFSKKGLRNAKNDYDYTFLQFLRAR